MAAPDFRRICGACIFAATGLSAKKTKKPADPVEGEEAPPEVVETPADALWKDLSAAEQNIFLEVAGFLHKYAGNTTLKNLDCEKAAEVVWERFDVKWAAVAVQIFKNVAQEFGHS